MQSEPVDRLNSLLRGEIAATQTYQQALEKIGNEPGALELRKIHDEHREAANSLRLHIRREHEGATPDHGSGAWGVWARTVEGTAKMFGTAVALKALKEGEEHGIRSYEEALEDAELPAECKMLIRSTLLPRSRAHIPVLDHLMQAQ